MACYRDNFTFFRERGCGGVDWINLVHDRDQWKAHVNMATELRVPYNVEKFLKS
jgi:hypothetical protein